MNEDDKQLNYNSQRNKNFKGVKIDLDKPSVKRPYLKDDMDEQTKERYKIVSDYEIKYLNQKIKHQNYEETKFVKEKIGSLRKIIADKIYDRCYNEFQELCKYLEITRMDESIYNLPLYTQDEEYNKAHEKFLYCSSYERNLLRRFDDKIRFLSFAYDYQYMLCKKNCIESKYYGTKPDYENCILQCLKYTDKNIDPSIEGMLEQMLDEYSHILNHIQSKDQKF